jgi:hypothetical protein
MFVGKSKANSSKAPLIHSLLGWLMALPKSIMRERLAWDKHSSLLESYKQNGFKHWPLGANPIKKLWKKLLSIHVS